jgi:hypothetical protein
MTYTRKRPAQHPKWPMPTGITAIIVGLACWLFPLRITRMLVKIGIYPSPSDEADGGAKLAAVGEVFHFMRQLSNIGVLLTVVGIALLAWSIVLKQKAQMQHELDHRERRASAAADAAARRNDPLADADYVREADGEERIVPKTARRRRTSHLLPLFALLPMMTACGDKESRYYFTSSGHGAGAALFACDRETGEAWFTQASRSERTSSYPEIGPTRFSGELVSSNTPMTKEQLSVSADFADRWLDSKSAISLSTRTQAVRGCR